MAFASDWSTEFYSVSTDSETDVKRSDEETRLEDDRPFVISDSLKNPSWYQIYSRVPLSHEVIATSFIALCGIIFNLIILRCYWRDKSRTAVYIRAFAIYDVCMVTVFCSVTLVNLGWPQAEWLAQFLMFPLVTLLSAGMLGPLFLAIDRVSMVVFPYTFYKYERRLRIFKISFGTVHVAIAAVLSAPNFPVSALALKVLMTTTSVLFVSQLIGCAVLYVIIALKVRKRKVQPANETSAPQ